jgi:hypothetical protein
MSPRDLEIELRRWRGARDVEPSNASPMEREEALAYRDSGNLPDALDRSLRIVIVVSSNAELMNLDSRRLTFEPDAHQAPSWRREGSRPINVVPLRREGVAASGLDSWADDPAMASMEDRWARTGMVGGIQVSAEVRGFVFKTVVALERAGVPVTVDAITDSLSRWLSAEDVARVAAGLQEPRAPS